MNETNAELKVRDYYQPYILVPIAELMRFLTAWVEAGKPISGMQKILGYLDFFYSNKIYGNKPWRPFNYDLNEAELRFMKAIGLPAQAVQNWVRVPNSYLSEFNYQLKYDKFFTKTDMAFLLTLCLKFIKSRNSARLSYRQFMDAFGFSKGHTSYSVNKLIHLKKIERFEHVGAEHWNAWWHGSNYEIFGVTNPKYSKMRDEEVIFYS